MSTQRAILDVLHGLVQCDGAALLSAAASESWSVASRFLNDTLLSGNYWRYVLEATPPIIAALASGFVRDLDVVDARSRDRAAVYREFHKPSGHRVYVARMWVADGRLWVIGMARGSGNFSDRAIRDLNALCPHVASASRLSLLMRDVANAALQGFFDEYALSSRLRDIAHLVIRGMRNAEIARLLGLSTNTIRNQLSEVFRRTNVTSRAELSFVASNHRECSQLSCARDARRMIHVVGQHATGRPVA